MRRVVAVLASAVCLASTPALAEDEFNPSPEWKAKIERIGQFVNIGGTCSRHLSPAQNRMVQGFVTTEKMNIDPADEWVRPHVRKMMSDLYIAGVSSPEAATITPAACVKLLNEDIDAMNAWSKR